MVQDHHDKSDKIRIAYVLYTNERGGVEEHVLSLIQHIDPNRYQSYLVAPSQLVEAFGKDLEDTGAVVYPCEIEGLTDFRGMGRAYSFFRANKIHIVHTHMFVTSVFFSPAAKLAGVPVLIETSHGVEKWRFEKGFLKKHSYVIDRIFSSLPNRILAVSYACRNDLINIKRISQEKIIVIQNGRDLDNFKPLPDSRRMDLRLKHGLSESEYVFGVLARLAFQKGHAYLFEAIQLLLSRRSDFKVIIVGDGPLKDDLESMAKRLDIQTHVIFAGFQRDMPGYHGMIDVNILPSLFEGLPLGVIEASAMEKPVIATAVDGTPEVISDKVTGLLVSPKDPQSLCDAMLYALEHKDKMDLMGKAGREFVLKHFTLERQIKETECLYEDCLSKENRGASISYKKFSCMEE